MSKDLYLDKTDRIEMYFEYWITSKLALYKGKALGASVEAVPRISKGKLLSSESSSESTEYISKVILTCLQTLKWLICSQQEALLISKRITLLALEARTLCYWKYNACIFVWTELTEKQQNKIHTQLQWTKKLSVHLKVNTTQKLAFVLWKKISIIGCYPVCQHRDFVCLLRWSRARTPKLPGQIMRFLNLIKYMDLLYW